jgi:hypothetical protein
MPPDLLPSVLTRSSRDNTSVTDEVRSEDSDGDMAA